jgi:hypothetical protein
MMSMGSIVVAKAGTLVALPAPATYRGNRSYNKKFLQPFLERSVRFVRDMAFQFPAGIGRRTWGKWRTKASLYEALASTI